MATVVEIIAVRANSTSYQPVAAGVGERNRPQTIENNEQYRPGFRCFVFCILWFAFSVTGFEKILKEFLL